MPNPVDTTPLFAMIGAVSPALLHYTQNNLAEELWRRPGMSARDRSIVTIAALVGRNSTLGYPYYFNQALENGLEPAEFSELLAHLAFYAGWPYAFGAIVVLNGIFDEGGIAVDQLPPANPELLSVEIAAPDESIRAAFIADAVVPVSAALKHFTTGLLDGEVWCRPGLTPRDRSLATVAVLAAMGQVELLPLYAGRAILHGVTSEQFGEALAHIAFCAGWGHAIKAAIALKPVLQTSN